jgi:integrase
MDNERVVDTQPMTELVVSTGAGDRDRLEDVMRRWLLEKATRSQSRDTVRAYSTTLTRFRAALHRAGLELDSAAAEVRRIAEAWTTGTYVSSVRRTDDARPASSATRNQRLAILSSFYAFAVGEEVVAANPITRVKRSVVQPYAGAAPLEDRAAVRYALASIDRTTAIGVRDYALLLVALQTGRRRAELAALTWGDVERIGERAIVTFRRCKGGKTMRDELPQRVTEALEEWRAAWQELALASPTQKSAVWVSLSRNGTEGHPLTGQALADLCERHLGTPRVHQLRHTWARTMEEKGAKVSQIQARLGHASLATTGIYLAAVGRGRAENPYAEVLADEWIA